MQDEFLWVEKYRPRTVSETILTKELKETFQKIVDGGEIPNMLFSGTAGTGKTTIARAICNELGLDYIVINGSDERNIETLRGKIKQFASSISLTGGYKVVILDEADYLNPTSTQPALRGFIEEFSKNCRFILTCNFKNRIIEPLHSRCSNYEFNFNKKIQAQLCGQFMESAGKILADEGVNYNPDTLGVWYRYWRCIQHIKPQLGFTRFTRFELNVRARQNSLKTANAVSTNMRFHYPKLGFSIDHT